ncbi:MAG: type II toxin-antitoxin system Phd/YefM family antitoxin [Clostridia bacterium]|nr:type II toxin-antitoxin system Phd/YefM family antitoxin [Clostridia bacterium]
MKASIKSMDIDYGLLNFTQHLVSISDFSRGKTSQLFDDVKNNNTEYVVLKNNQPTAMVISLDMYKTLVEKAMKMEQLLDRIEENRLLVQANNVVNKTDVSSYEEFDDICEDLGFDPGKIESECESVEIE